MQQTLIDFLVKSTEVILLSRLKDLTSINANQSLKIFCKLDESFQLKLHTQYGIQSKIPSEWSLNEHKLLVIEFFLISKITNQKFLIEQWNFDINENVGNKKRLSLSTINTNINTNNNSPQAKLTQQFYKRLTILLRSIIVLGNILPLYRNYVNEKSSKIRDMFNLDYNIHFSFRSLSDWHPIIRDDSNNLGNYTNEEIFTQGLQFAFKVNYLKNLSIVFRLLEDEARKKPILTPIKTDFEFKGPKRSRFLSSDNAVDINTTDSNRNNTSMFGNESPRNTNYGSHGTEKNLSPVDCIFGASSPIGTQKPPKIFSEYAKTYKSSAESSIISEKLSLDAKPKDSMDNPGIEIYMVTNEDDKFTEIDFGKEIPIRYESPALLNIGHPEESKPPLYLDQSKKDYNQLKLSMHNTEKLEKIIQQNEDDKIANILNIIENLNKTIWSIRESRTKDGTHSKSKISKAINDINVKQPKGIKFKLLNMKSESNSSEFMSFYEDLKKFNATLEN